MELFEATREMTSRAHDAGNRGEPLKEYLLERPSLLLTFLDVAERYADDCTPEDGAR